MNSLKKSLRSVFMTATIDLTERKENVVRVTSVRITINFFEYDQKWEVLSF